MTDKFCFPNNNNPIPNEQVYETLQQGGDAPDQDHLNYLPILEDQMPHKPFARFRTLSWADRPSPSRQAGPLRNSQDRPLRLLRHVKSSIVPSAGTEDPRTDSSALPNVGANVLRQADSSPPLSRSFSRKTTAPALLSDRRFRTSSATSISASVLRTRNALFGAKRWSTVLSWRTANGQANAAAASGSNNGRSRDAILGYRFFEASAYPLPESPSTISAPFNVCAAPGSALRNVIDRQASPDIPPRVASSPPRMNDDVHLVDASLSMPSRAQLQTRSRSRLHSRTTPPSLSSQQISGNSGQTRCRPGYDSLHTFYGSVSKTDHRSVAMPTRDSTRELPLCQPMNEAHLSIAVGDTSEQSSFYAMTAEQSFVSEPESFRTCPTPALDAASSEGASTPALTDREAFAQSPTCTVGPIRRESMYAHHARQKTSQKASTEAMLSNHSHTHDIFLWGSQPDGLRIEGDDLANKLQRMLVDDDEKGRQARLYAWRRHASDEDDTCPSQESVYTATIEEKKVANSFAVRRKMVPKTSIADFLEAARCAIVPDEVVKTPTMSDVERRHRVCEEDDALASGSVFDGYGEKVQIQTAWRGNIVSLHNRLPLTNANFRQLHQDDHTERKAGPFANSRATTFRGQSRSRCRTEDNLFSSEIPLLSSFVAQDGVSPDHQHHRQRSVSELADDTFGEIDLCAHLLHRAKEYRRFAFYE